MDKNKQEVVDGFSDKTDGKATVDPPDVGGERKQQPMSPEEYAAAKKAAEQSHEQEKR